MALPTGVQRHEFKQAQGDGLSDRKPCVLQPLLGSLESQDTTKLKELAM